MLYYMVNIIHLSISIRHFLHPFTRINTNLNLLTVQHVRDTINLYSDSSHLNKELFLISKTTHIVINNIYLCANSKTACLRVYQSITLKNFFVK